jgi:hypothetical protein
MGTRKKEKIRYNMIMLTIICGEDVVAAREYFSKLRHDLEAGNLSIQDVDPVTIKDEISKNDTVLNLFSDKVIYFTSGLNGYISRGGRTTPEYIEQISQSKELEVYDWEPGKSSRDLRLAKYGTVKEFKPQKNIFHLLDACYPGNRQGFLTLLQTVAQSSDDMLIFTLLSRHMRALLLSKYGEFGPRVQPWQRGKIQSQAKYWQDEKLAGFYEGMTRIDVSLKTSGTPYTLKESLDILACYYL